MQFIHVLFAIALISAIAYALPPANLSLIKSGSFNIPANTSWTETLYVEPGQYVVINANGKWRYDPRPQFETGPDGLSNVFLAFPPGKLIGKFGDGDVFSVGSNWEGYATNRGRLLLGIYEPKKGESIDVYKDNSGSLNVTIQVFGELPQLNEETSEVQSIQEKNTSVINKTEPENQEAPTRTEQLCIASIVLFISALLSLGILNSLE